MWDEWFERKVNEELEVHQLVKHGLGEMPDKHFIDNGVMILNRETYYALFKDILNEGRLAAIKSKSWMLDEQIKKKLKKIQSFNR